ncbi:MAG: hypothetical protein AAGA62_16750 [Bacteroidota bacterium]
MHENKAIFSGEKVAHEILFAELCEDYVKASKPFLYQDVCNQIIRFDWSEMLVFHHRSLESIMSNFSHLANAHPSYIENLYEQFSQAPDSVDESWRDFFLGFDYASENGNGGVSKNGSALPTKATGEIDWEHVQKELRVFARVPNQ